MNAYPTLQNKHSSSYTNTFSSNKRSFYAPEFDAKLYRNQLATDYKMAPSHSYLSNVETNRSVKTSTHLIPNQGTVSQTPIYNQSNKPVQSFHQITPKQVSTFTQPNNRSRSYEDSDKEQRFTTKFSTTSNKNSFSNESIYHTKTYLPEQEFIIKPNISKPIQSNFDKFGNKLPSWAKPDQEESSQQNHPSYSTGYKPSILLDYEDNDKPGAPQFLRKLAPVIKRNERQQARLELEVSGTPEPQVHWFKDGMPIKNTPDTRLSSNFGLHTLVIPEVFKEDSGVYRALVTSPLGTLESFCHLIIEGFLLLFFNIFIKNFSYFKLKIIFIQMNLSAH